MSTAELVHLPKPAQRNRWRLVPAALLGQLAVQEAHQGRGLGKDLLLDALQGGARVANDVAAAVEVIVHAMEHVKTLYP
jgi:predicted N-acetyltransferase YhbS